MAPNGWPKQLTYATAPVAPEMHLSILRDFLSTGNPDDLGKSVDLVAEHRIHPHLEIQKITAAHHPLSQKHTLQGHPNLGLFANEKIPAGTVLGEYVGEMFLYFTNPETSIETVFRRLPFSEYRWMIQAHDLFLAIDGQNIANELALVNDYRGIAPEPNVKMAPLIHHGKTHFGYAVIRDIEKGEELLADYGEMFWKAFYKQR